MLPKSATVSRKSFTETVSRAVTELEWLAFFLPRKGVQSLARRIPLAALRDRLPRSLASRLRMGLYPARITTPPSVECLRRHPAWGDPVDLDPARPVRFAGRPRASILMPTYGNVDLTRLCLASLQRAAGPVSFEVIIVDNASPDATTQYLRSVVERGLIPLRVVENRINQGFSRATNQAAALARGDVLVFLNNDTVVRPGWLEGLVGHLDDDPTIGLVGPVTNSSGSEAELGTSYADLDAMARFADAYTRAHDGETADADMLTLFCAAISRELYRAVGGLDERYGIGMFEDDDLSEAVRRAGRRVVLARDVFVHHYGGAAFSRFADAQYLRLWWSNRRAYEKKWNKSWRKR